MAARVAPTTESWVQRAARLVRREGSLAANPASPADSDSSHVAQSTGGVELASHEARDRDPFDAALYRLPAPTGPALMLLDGTGGDSAGAAGAAIGHGPWWAVRQDHREFYSPDGLAVLTAGFAAGALIANTAMDQNIFRDPYIESIVLAPTHEYYESLHRPKVLGDGWYTIPAFSAAALVEPLFGDVPAGRPVAEWGQRSLRMVVVGGPPVLAAQWLTGGSRPGETPAGSRWKPLQDDNGVSGHSFMGAIPFLSAAIVTDQPWLKGGLYAASMLPALSRVNDDDHYFSQALLGWWMAFAASRAVDRVEQARHGPRLVPFVSDDHTGLGVVGRF